MADFRQLALEFVLAEDETKLSAIAQQAARDIQASPAATNPVARWVEAVQPWMPVANEDDVVSGGADTPNWTARAKALDFLSRTLYSLPSDVLKPSQVKLLVGFFGAMFDIDHKAGIMASAMALSRIITMKAFQPQSGNDIIEKVCAMKDDFSRQLSKTRLVVYELLRSLVVRPHVASDLQQKHGAASGFMADLLRLCRNERDPDCLMVWFDILVTFLTLYSPSKEMQEEVYETFRSYFPITLPRSAQSSVTPEELKLQLRGCFSSNNGLAPLTFPFLIGKLDQGDGVTVNVKVDILKTIKACLESYDHPEQSVVPYVNQIWGSLKYEVRNGDVEDTTWATLEVLKTLTTKLKGDALRDYALTVTRDCVNDLSNITYTAPAGRLLVSVLSASPSAFVLMVAPAITHIKENLRHPKTSAHSRDLFKLLHVILETRGFLSEAEMTAQERGEFASIDAVFKSLYVDVYKKPLSRGGAADASEEDLTIATAAVPGAGALVCQRPVNPAAQMHDTATADTDHLLPVETCTQICQALFSIVTQSCDMSSGKPGLDELGDETTSALQKALGAQPDAFGPLVDAGMAIIRSSWTQPTADSAETTKALGISIAFIGCSQLPRSPAKGLSNFAYYIRALALELRTAIDMKSDVSIWCSLAAALQSAVRNFNDACQGIESQNSHALDASSWLPTIIAKYPELKGISTGTDGSASDRAVATDSAAIRDDFLLISLFIVRELYRRATKAVDTGPSGGSKALELSDDFAGVSEALTNQYLHLISTLAGFVVHEMSEGQQTTLHAQAYALHLFRDDFIDVTQAPLDGGDMSKPEAYLAEKGTNWVWLTLGRVNMLSFGLMEALRPSVTARLFDSGVAQAILYAGSFVTPSRDPGPRSVTWAMLSVLANKYEIEKLEPFRAILEQKFGLVQDKAPRDPAATDAMLLEQATSLYAICAGMLRRYCGPLAQGLLKVLREAPGYPAPGRDLARRLEMVVAPQAVLTKDHFAKVKPLWVQRVYMELVTPMLEKATGSGSETLDPVLRTNFGVGVVLMLKHMNVSVYEADSDAVLRMAIAIAQTTGSGPESLAALGVLKDILGEEPEHAQAHLRSIINICVSAFSAGARSTSERQAGPQSGSEGAGDAQLDAERGRLALEIAGGLPRALESRHLVPFAPQVERELTLACGHRVRDLRRVARLARAAWSGLK